MIRRLRFAAVAALCLGAAAAATGVLSASPQDRIGSASLATGKVVRLHGGALGYLPASAPADRPKRLLVVMGGTGSDPATTIRMFKGPAEAAGIVLVAPSSRDENFDAIENFFDDLDARKASARLAWPAPRFGDDAAGIDAALRQVFAATRISPRHVGILGFSHGGSYALSLGTANPQLFGSVAALSPGVLIFESDRPGRQRIFLAHGRSDEVQPFARTSRNFVNKLKALGYDVTFEPYDGGHNTPGPIIGAALNHFIKLPVTQAN